jgi:hypothetical protein
MRNLLVSLLLLLIVAGTARAVTSPAYYLALGDSLAQGVQPSPTGNTETNQGYADDLFAVLSTRVPGLSLMKLGCPGETTSTMIHGGVCSYAEGSQLGAAIRFIQTHRIAFISTLAGATLITALPLLKLIRRSSRKLSAVLEPTCRRFLQRCAAQQVQTHSLLA